MRTRAAYISSVGTTSILVAAALLMLAMVSALVAFEHWPGGTSGDAVTSVSLSPPAQQVKGVRAVRKATPVPGRKLVAVARRIGGRTATVGIVKNVTVRGPAVIGLVKQPSGSTNASQPPPHEAPPPQPPERIQPPATVPQQPPDTGTPVTLPTASDVQGVVGGVVGAAPPPPGQSEQTRTLGLELTLGDTSLTIPLP